MNLAGDFSRTGLINSLGGRDNFDSRDWFSPEKTPVLDFVKFVDETREVPKVRCQVDL